MKPLLEAYLDIETTGLSAFSDDITVIGIYLSRGEETECVQLVGGDINRHTLLEILDGVDIIYTYNGHRFDLPFINKRLGVNLEEIFKHRDLMFDCWRCNLRGGFKAVERQLGIPRELVEVDGRVAIRLWWRYVETFDLEALDTLLAYNREDIVNLKELKDRLI